jgi:hypothetical protein
MAKFQPKKKKEKRKTLSLQGLTRFIETLLTSTNKGMMANKSL